MVVYLLDITTLGLIEMSEEATDRGKWMILELELLLNWKSYINLQYILHLIIKTPEFVIHCWLTLTVQYSKSSKALDNFSTEEYVTSSVPGQSVFDSPSWTLVIGANIFKQI
jgi:hypothetical protein